MTVNKKFKWGITLNKRGLFNKREDVNDTLINSSMNYYNRHFDDDRYSYKNLLESFFDKMAKDVKFKIVDEIKNSEYIAYKSQITYDRTFSIEIEGKEKMEKIDFFSIPVPLDDYSFLINGVPKHVTSIIGVNNVAFGYYEDDISLYINSLNFYCIFIFREDGFYITNSMMSKQNILVGLHEYIAFNSTTKYIKSMIEKFKKYDFISDILKNAIKLKENKNEEERDSITRKIKFLWGLRPEDVKNKIVADHDLRYFVNRILEDEKFHIIDEEETNLFLTFAVILHENQNKKYLFDKDSLINKKLIVASNLLYKRIYKVLYGLMCSNKNINSVNKFKSLCNEIQQNSFAFKTMINTGNYFQLLESINPITNDILKRKATLLNPGTIEIQNASSSLRNIYSSYFGRICGIETPEGLKIGLVFGLARGLEISVFGDLLVKYYKIENGKINRDKIYKLSAIQDYGEKIADIENEDRDIIYVKHGNDIYRSHIKNATYTTLFKEQFISWGLSQIPFINNNYTVRALMLASMIRQSLSLVNGENPNIITSLDSTLSDTGKNVIYDTFNNRICYDESSNKFKYTNLDALHLTYQYASNMVDLNKFDSISGSNLFCSVMFWRGYNFEDAVVLSDEVVRKNKLASLHTKIITVKVLKTAVGNEITTTDILNPSVDISNLDDNGIIKPGSIIKSNDILVGKITPKQDLKSSGKDKILHLFFPEEMLNVDDTSEYTPSDISEGIVRKVEIIKHNRKPTSEIEDKINEEIESVHKDYEERYRFIYNFWRDNMCDIKLSFEEVLKLIRDDDRSKADENVTKFLNAVEKLKTDEADIIKNKISMNKIVPNELYSIVIHIINKRNIQIGDKISNRSGNKGVVSHIANQSDMPFIKSTGKSIECIIYSLGIVARMNIGQLFEMKYNNVLDKIKSEAAESLNDEVSMKSFISKIKNFIDYDHFAKIYSDKEFINALIKNIYMVKDAFKSIDKEQNKMLHEYFPANHKEILVDGITGKTYDNPISVGKVFYLKLNHMVEDKINVRSTAGYTSITQQPMAGKNNRGGQRVGLMEIWGILGYGATQVVRELTTVKSDSMIGRHKMYKNLLEGKPVSLLNQKNMPETSKVLKNLLLVMRIRLGFMIKKQHEENN